jgi:GNAT superfamily N-acetyltransferase
MGGATIRHVGQPGDLGWIVQAHGEQYAEEFDWDTDFEALVARIVADFAGAHDPAREQAWIAEMGGERVGCIMCVADEDPTVARLRILLVTSAGRGTGTGTALVTTCVEFAREAGYDQMVLWTNDVLTAARQIYERAGFTLVAREEHHAFGHDLVGQTWELDLRTG